MDRQPKPLKPTQKRILFALNELAKEGFRPSEAGLLSLLNGDEERFASLRSYGIAPSLKKKRLTLSLNHLREERYVRRDFEAEEGDYYYALLGRGEEALRNYRPHGRSVAKAKRYLPI